MAKKETIKARVLCDARINGIYLKVGQIALLPKSALTPDLDPHPDAVSYAESQGAKLVDVTAVAEEAAPPEEVVVPVDPASERGQ